MSETVNVAIIGVGNCASSLVQGVQYYKDAARTSPGARPDARRPRRLPRPRHRVHRRLRRRRHARSARTWPRRSSPSPTTRSSSPTCRTWASPVHRGHDPRRPRQVPLRGDRRRPPAPTADIVGILQRHQHRRGGQLPAGRLREGHQVVRRADPARRLRLRQLHPGLHRVASATGRSASASAACRSSATTSRARSAPPSSTAMLAHLFARARRASSTAPTSSTSAATPTSSTCSSASGWSRRRSPRPTRSPRSARLPSWRRTTSTSARATTCRG